ncbi:hypothetical protein J6590_030330 [Homalodisca vitripennis]|nr:hypothetical protein J6590_030330 [Homalodisca vitripennis]
MFAMRKKQPALLLEPPGGRTKDILNDTNFRDNKFEKELCLNPICGTNDVARNEASEALEGYDLKSWSCGNKEVRKTNISFARILSTASKCHAGKSK